MSRTPSFWSFSAVKVQKALGGFGLLLFMRCDCRATGEGGLSSVTQQKTWLCKGWAGLNPAKSRQSIQSPCVIQEGGGKTNQASNR